MRPLSVLWVFNERPLRVQTEDFQAQFRLTGSNQSETEEWIYPASQQKAVAQNRAFGEHNRQEGDSRRATRSTLHKGGWPVGQIIPPPMLDAELVTP